MTFQENKRLLGLSLPGMNARRMADRHLFTQMSNAGQLNVVKYQAPTGIGSFDASFKAATMTYEITIKVYFEFLPEKIGDPNIKWDDQSKSDYKRDTITIVQDEWSNRYLIKCIKDGWEDIAAKVEVKVLETSREEAHFHLKAKRLADTGKSSGGGVAWKESPPSIDVDSLGLKPKYQQDMQMRQFNMREKLIEESLFECGSQVIEFDHNSSSITINSKAKLARLANKLKMIVKPDIVGIKLCIYGSTSGFDIHKRARKRADAVCQHMNTLMPRSVLQFEALTSLNVDQKKLALKSIQRHKQNFALQSPDTSGCILFVYTGNDVVRESPTNYIVMVHEFGHTLGLPDEYSGRLHPRIAATSPLNSVIPATMIGHNLSGAENYRWIDNAVERQKDINNMRLANQQLGFARLQTEQGASAEMPFFTNMAGESTVQDKADYFRSQSAFEKEVKRLETKYGKGSAKVKTYQASATPAFPISVGSSSIMHSGMDIFPAHYLTIWSSLVEATRAFILPNEWQIDPNPLKV